MLDDAETEAALRRLAAVSDTELAADILTAVDEVLVVFDTWYTGPGWRDDDLGRRLSRTVDRVRAAVTTLPDRGDLAAAGAAVRPLLGEYWPSWPAPDAPAVAVAVERLRTCAMHRPSGIAQVRSIVATRYDRGRRASP